MTPPEDGGGIPEAGTEGDGSNPTPRDGSSPPPCFASDAGELCNGLDDDCDRRIDEDFDLGSDPRHCGACNHVCQFHNADVACQAGTCVTQGCFDGFVDSILEPVACPSFGTTVLPVLHPAYQHVWLSRLGYEVDDYRAEIGRRIDAIRTRG